MILNGKIALVTGGSHGLGSFVVRALAGAGAKVAFTYASRQDLADALVAGLESAGAPGVQALRSDATSTSEAAAAVAACIDAFGDLDVLINNVGGAGRGEGPIWTLSEETWDEVLAINLKSCFNFTRATAPHFMQRHGGTIVNVGSINGLRGREGQPAYTAAKAGLVGFTKTIARELGMYDVNVNLIATGYVDTDKQRTKTNEVSRRHILNDCAMKHLVQPEEVADLIVALCGPAFRHVTGSVVRLDSGEYM